MEGCIDKGFSGDCGGKSHWLTIALRACIVSHPRLQTNGPGDGLWSMDLNILPTAMVRAFQSPRAAHWEKGFLLAERSSNRVGMKILPLY
jgi:hypothetical protein